MTAVSVQELEFRYGERVALNNVSFQIPSGEIFGVLGPNGGGKSTLFRVLSTLLPIQGGNAEVMGLDVKQRADAVRRAIGVTFQSPSLDLKLTVIENLKVQGHLYGLFGRTLRERCGVVMEQLGIVDRAGDLAERLSGGLKRRVEIAKCLLHSPQVLLMDEPSTGLDPGARYDLWQILFKLRKESNVTILITTHLMEEADLCDRLCILDEGNLIAEGPPDELRNLVGGDSLLIEGQNLPELSKDLEAELTLEVQQVGGSLRIEHQDGHQLLSQIATRYAGRFTRLTLGKPSLEDVFIKLTGRTLDAGETE
ncbi:ATP-binding cassette domain-containing protein [Planctomicrobium sp.]|jgi:ABC-2 type transport system ATP-binding protein|nr:ATP-binding cassette domain-containing protein [Planctomicrobium sp.]MBT5019618.1 ATP-binding cassette domain-containing protein [Planctomicrobium sp.]MDB4733577.1 ATP-binding cassette domain-containing protein [Planctomicrobium sp.]